MFVLVRRLANAEHEINRLRAQLTQTEQERDEACAQVEAAHDAIDDVLEGVKNETGIAALAVRGALVEVRAALEDDDQPIQVKLQ